MNSNIKTPVYLYDLELLRNTLNALTDASANPSYRVHYAMKANANPMILAQIKETGLGVDTVSGGEIRRAIEAGFAPKSIVFAGVGKTDEEIQYALSIGIGCFNVESLPELINISEIASQLGVVAPIALRVNPNIDAHTHHYITTGLSENKFGIDLRQLDAVVDKARELPGIDLQGLHFHIGSQVTIAEPFRILSQRINELQTSFEKRGVTFRSINVGGGLGIDYDNPQVNPIPDFKSYFDAFSELQLREGQELHFELGRAIVGQCGTLLTKVLYVKEGVDKTFAIVDAGMTELIRPALYGALHHIVNLSNPQGAERLYDVVGPICESSDTFATDLTLPEVRRGDLLRIFSAGAYGETMASQYNSRQLPSSIRLSEFEG